jgi:hypothetical protein
MSTLVNDLDKAVAKLLQTAGLGDTVEGEKCLATLTEQVKAFDSAMDYAKIRPTLIPKETVESPFASLKRDFDGDAPARRGRRAKAKKDDGADDGDESGAGQLFS